MIQATPDARMVSLFDEQDALTYRIDRTKVTLVEQRSGSQALEGLAVGMVIDALVIVGCVVLAANGPLAHESF